MSVTTAIAKPYARRFTLARFTVRWLPESSDWVMYDGTSPYTMYVEFDKPLAAVKKQSTSSSWGTVYYAVSLSAAASLGALANNEYYYDESAGRLYAKTTSPNDVSLARVVIEYYVYVSTNGLYAGSNPVTTPTGALYWEPRLLDPPDVEQSVTDAVVGVLTVGSGSLKISNVPEPGSSTPWFDPHMADRSVLNGAVAVWSFVDDIANCVGYRQGRIRSFSVDSQTVALDFYDALGALYDPAYMGDQAAEAIVRNGVTALDVAHPNHYERPIPFVAGRLNYVKFSKVAHSTTFTNFEFDDADEASNVSYSAVVSTSNNRTHVLCRIPAGSVVTKSCSTPTRAALDPYGGGTVYHVQANTHNLVAGDVVSFNDGSVRHGVVESVATHTYSGNSYNMIWKLTFGATTPNGRAITCYSEPTIWWLLPDGAGGYVKNLVKPGTFTTTYTATTGGNYIVTVALPTPISATYYQSTLLSTFGDEGVAWDTFDPATHKILFQIEPNTTTTHGTVAQRILEKCGLTVNAASVTSANASLTTKARFNIPNVGEGSYRSAAEYLGDLLKSVGGFVNLNTSGEIEYGLLGVASSEWSLDRNDCLSVSFSDEGGDAIYQYVLTNPHDPTPGGTFTDLVDNGSGSLTFTSTPESTVQDRDAGQRHQLYAASEAFGHCLESIVDRDDYLLSLRSKPRRTWQITTRLALLDAGIGDVFTLTHAIAENSTAELTIIGITKSHETVQITAVEL